MYQYTLDGRRVKSTRTNYFPSVSSATPKKVAGPNANRLGMWLGISTNNEVTQLPFTVIVETRDNDGSTNLIGVLSSATPFLYFDAHKYGPDLLGEIYVVAPGGTAWGVGGGEVAANETE